MEKKFKIELNRAELDTVMGYLMIFAEDPCDEEEEKDCKELLKKLKKQIKNQ